MNFNTTRGDDVWIGGVRIRPSLAIPPTASNFKLDPKVPLSDAFRSDMQAWLDGFFGTHMVAYLIDPKAAGIGFVGDKLVVTHPENIVKIRLGTAKWSPSGREVDG